MDNALMDVGLPLILGLVMVGIGLTLSVSDFQRQRKTPKPLVVGVVGQTIVVPLIGLAIAVGLHLSADLAIGVVLLAATAGGTTSNVLTYLARGNVALSLVLTVVANLATIVSLPFWAGVALERWGEAVGVSSYVSVGFFDVAGLLIGLVLVPTSLGMLVRSRRPALAARLERPVSRFSFLALFGLIVGVVISLGSEALTMIRQAGPATLLLSCVAAAVGVGMGILTRLPRTDQVALGMEFGIKNITLTMLLALTALGSEEIALPAAVYGVLAYIPGLVLLNWGRRTIALPGAEEAARPQRPVLVGYDGSEAAWPAVRWAGQEAVETQRPVRIILAWGLPTLGVSPSTASSDLSWRQAQRQLWDAQDRLAAELPGLTADGDLVQEKPAQALVNRSGGAALVVVGHRSKGQVGRLVMGSVSSAVVSHSEAPVVVVRGDEQGNVRRAGPIVVGVDGSPSSEAAVEFALQASPRYGFQVVAVHVGDPAPTGGLDSLSPALAKARTEYPAVQVREVLASTASPADHILAEADRGASLVVVGSRGRGGVAGMVLGSVSRAVVENSTCPVVVLRDGS